MKPVILFLIQVILIASHAPYSANGEKNDKLFSVSALDAKLMSAVKKYNAAITAQRETLGEITDLAKRLQQSFVDKIAKLSAMDDPNATKLVKNQLNQLKKVLEDVIAHYADVLCSAENVPKVDQPKLKIQSATEWYAKVSTVTIDLFYLMSADNFPRLMEMRKRDEKLANVLIYTNSVYKDLLPEQRANVAREIMKSTARMSLLCDEGDQAVRNGMSSKNCTQFQAMLDGFARLKNHYQKVRDAGWTKDNWDSLFPINGLETSDTIKNIYYDLAQGIFKWGVTF